MIINAYSMLMLFMAGLGIALACVTGVVALVAALRVARSHNQRDTSRADRLVHLATLSTIVSLAVVVTGWPLLYLMLNSFVPEIPGAMCIYGVTRVMPHLTTVVQAAAPALLFAMGGWLLLDIARRRTGRPVRRPCGLLVLALLCACMIAFEGTQLYYVLHAESLDTVSCCSSYGEGTAAKLQTPSYYLPWQGENHVGQPTLVALFYLGVGLLGIWLVALARGRVGRHALPRVLHACALLAAAICVILVSLITFGEVLSPRFMGLPFHHCLYCFIGNGRVPDAPIMLANLLAGTFAAGWVALLGLVVPPSGDTHDAVYRRLCLVGAATLFACLIMVAVHWGVTG